MTQRTSNILSRDWFFASIVSLITFVVYLMTMCRTVSFIDAGELATVAALLGVAHPTGYPLFSILAHSFLWVPIGGEEILRLNVFSSLVVAVGVGTFYYVLLAIKRYGYALTAKGKTRAGEDEGPESRIAASIGALIFGFSTTVWSQSVAIEVYGLHVLLILLTLYAFFEGLRLDLSGADHIPHQMIAAAFLLGVSFTNHMTTILVVPALVFLYFWSYGFRRSSFLRAAKLFGFFVLGVSLYAYLPLRAWRQPPVNWGYPAELERLFWHLSGKQYRSWMFSSFDSAEKQLKYFFDHFHAEYNWLVIVVLVYGIWRALKSSENVFWFLVVAVVSCVFYSINYDIYDIDSYFLLAYIVSGVFVFFGISALVEAAKRKGTKKALPAVFLALLILPGVQVYLNHAEVDESDNSLVTDYTHNILAGVEPNAVIVSYQWDYFVASAEYFQLVRNERPDVVVIDKELLRRSWYFIQLKNRFPWLMERSRRKVDAFLVELYKFEHNLPYDARDIENCYVEMINDMISRSLDDHPVYLGPEMEPEFGRQFQKVPAGLLFRLARNTDTVFVRSIKVEYRPASIDTRLTRGIRGMYARMLTATGAYFLNKSRVFEADSCIEKALSIEPTFEPAKALKRELSTAGGREKR